MMKLELGKFYVTRNGALAKVVLIEEGGYKPAKVAAAVFRSGKVWLANLDYNLDGTRIGASHESPNDIIREREEPYTCFMMKVPGHEAIPIPNREVGEDCIKKNGGRVFRMMEVIE